MPIYYHIAKRRHVPSILTRGLVPGFRRGISPSYAPKRKQVYLTNDVRYVAEEQAGHAWCRRHKPVVFAVELAPEELTPVQYHGGGTYTISGFEFTTARLPASRLHLLGTLENLLAG